ncbi:thiamine pyrophosphate-dependent dehydrogenase E1 component subunit alpha [Eubacteriales bacterium OttesenSCG-928-N13]|nr:thiamine pyrophosphate-dependent dehydrogenase E1 component subunit alpha [Eubacteriales bacterium OttesenSCG-928-N13]
MEASMKKELYIDMLRLRRFEENVRDLFAAGELPGFVHLYIGEEAVAVGACSAIHSDDYITSTHRGHGHVLAKGAQPDKMFAELFAKSTGYNKAKGGSMHLAAPQLGILGANGIVGGGIPLATGAAMTAKLTNSGRVALCFFGDGASAQGTFHESVNIAASYNLPCVYICENNLYAGGVKQNFDGEYVNEGMDYPRKLKDVADRAAAYGIPGVIVNGNDVEAVHDAVKAATDRARAGEGPTLIECKTYKWRTHFEGEPDSYRPPEEVARWKELCPVHCFGQKLAQENVLSEQDLLDIDQQVNKEMQDAIAFARNSPDPTDAQALEDVYA